MSILDRLMGKKEEESEKPKKKTEKVKAEKKDKIEKASDKSDKPAKKGKTEKPKKEIRTGKISKKDENIAHRILIEPLVTEKSTDLGRLNKYVFKVNQNAGKHGIKSAVEDYYGVRVTKVNIVKIFPKKRIRGRTIGWKQGFKKAIVTLQEGDTIGAAEGV